MDNRYIYEVIFDSGVVIPRPGTYDLTIDEIAKSEILGLGAAAENAEKYFDEEIDFEDAEKSWALQGIIARAAARAGFQAACLRDEQGDVIVADMTAVTAPTLKLVAKPKSSKIAT
ncbi:MAG: hypothetical protein OXC63_08155 [Aestuariivita sp.]|nr:hypothetical protein [Aestuariivita sp.]MCY4345363.1 hypothetical protein [Aestuariivita sp.]